MLHWLRPAAKPKLSPFVVAKLQTNLNRKSLMRRRQLLALSVMVPFALAGCDTSGGDGAGASGASTGPGKFTYSPEGYPGLTVETEGPAERIAMDFYSAAALAPYGVKPVAVFGFGEKDSPGQAFDQTGVEVVGRDSDLDIEALAATSPDLIIAYGNEKGDGWTWWEDKMTSQVGELAPFVPIKLSSGEPDEMFAQFAAIAKALGKETETGEIAKKRSAYEAARERIRGITKERGDLTVLLANFSPEIIYTAKTLGVATMLANDGVKLAGPESGPEGGWAEVSWEKISDYPSDVLLVHDFSAEYEDNPIYRSLPAVKAEQLGTWDDKRAYIYDGYAEWLGELAEVLEKAKDVVK